MTTDNNDKLMAQFIEAASKNPEFITALKDALTDDVKAVAQKELQPFRENSEKLLDQLKDSQRESDGLTKLAQQVAALQGKPAQEAVHQISKQDAKDPVKYRQARAAAEKAGLPLQMVEGDAA